VRLGEDKKNEFITYFQVDEIVAKYAIKQWREKCRKNSKSPRYWMITELGQKSTERLHLHGIIFNSKGSEKIKRRKKMTEKKQKSVTYAYYSNHNGNYYISVNNHAERVYI
jgi:hypothetical protein